jgi:hypothetical protein
MIPVVFMATSGDGNRASIICQRSFHVDMIDGGKWLSNDHLSP